MQAPEIYERHYNRNFYRATWILTALDAGFMTAMNVRPAPLRHVLSILLTGWYLIFADDADEKVRKIRMQATVPVMRLSWEKSTSPILWAVTAAFRPSVGVAKDMWIPRSGYGAHPAYPIWKSETRIKLFFAGNEEELKMVRKVLLHFPGGGFVTMSPENHEEYTRRWTRQLGKSVCVVSVDYGKAPEFPFPYALEECFELYKLICDTNGRCLGINMGSSVMSEDKNYQRIRITLVGDSAGGNLVAGVTLKIILYNRNIKQKHPELFDENSELIDQRSKHFLLPKPEGILIAYGALNFDMGCWIAPSHAPLVRPDSTTSLSGIMRKYKGKKYHQERSPSLNALSVPDAVLTAYMDRRDSLPESDTSSQDNDFAAAVPSNIPGIHTDYVSMTSRVSYFSDRIITPELTRAMALLYMGQQSTVNPATDMFFSPIVIPDEYLEEFPKVWMMCGECDPLVDDTVIFAARVRNAVATRLDRERLSSSNSSRKQKQKQHKESAPQNPPEAGLNAAKANGGPSVANSPHPSNSTSRFGWLVDSVVNRAAVFINSRNTSTTNVSVGESAKGGVMDETDSSDEFDDFDEAYGEITQDAASHVTVKIYAGLSHAYLNMWGFLPEARHAITLCGHWLEEMFDAGEAARQRRRARRALLRKKKALLEGPVAPEIRDEDNIPETIELPFGAEYRIGGTKIQHHDQDHMTTADRVQKQTAQIQKLKRREKMFHVGSASDSESEAEDAGPDIPIEDDQSKNVAPLSSATDDKRRLLAQTLREPHTATFGMSHRTLVADSVAAHRFTIPLKDETSDEEKSPVRTMPSITATKSAPMFLAESDLVSKRRASLVRDVYSGVDPQILKSRYSSKKERAPRPDDEHSSPMEEVGGNDTSRPNAD